jgi:hypothetical protein
MSKPPDLFDPIIADAKLDPLFRVLMGSEHHRRAREAINAAFARMGDPNGHFASQFQGSSFHARLFEIACFSYLEASGFAPDRGFSAPDFMVSKEGLKVAVEVTTANPPDGADRDIGATRIENLSFELILEKTAIEFPRRMNAALKKKAGRQYHAEGHVAGKPIVLMIQPAFEAGSNFYIDESLAPCLFGDGSEAPGFFGRDDARPISAVVYCNGFTVSKFWRLSSLDLFRTTLRAIREGACRIEGDATPNEPKFYRLDVGDPANPQETWSEGVTVFLNPNAITPLPVGVFPASCTVALRGRSISRQVKGFHPLTSVMVASPRRDCRGNEAAVDEAAS